jgi:hypothetical protein
MDETNGPRIAWHRGKRGPTYFGGVSYTGDAIRLTGRDPVLGIDVALSIPVEEVEQIGIAEERSGSTNGSSVVVLRLPGSEPIYLRPVGGSSLDIHLLARTMGLAPQPAPALIQGGRA